MKDITQLTQVRRLRAVVCDDDELKATLELLIVLCNILLNNATPELLELIKTELYNE